MARGGLSFCLEGRGQPSGTGRRAGRALSLIELVMVVAIIGILGAIAVPRFSHSIARYRADAAARRVAADLGLARHQAIHTSAQQSVLFSGNGYSLAGVRHLDRSSLGYKVDLSASPYSAKVISVNLGGDAEVRFDVYGTPDSGGSIIIEAGGRQRTIRLDAETGRPIVE